MTEAWPRAACSLADGLFPAGGFAHSFGLETYVQDGAVSDRAGLEAFVTAHLEGSAWAGRRGGASPRRPAGGGRRRRRVGRARRADGRHEGRCRSCARPARQMGRQTRRVAATLVRTPSSPRVEHAGRRRPDAAAIALRSVRRRCWAAPASMPKLAAGAYLCTTAALLVGAGLRLIALGSALDVASASRRDARHASRGWPPRRAPRRWRTCGPSIPAWSWRRSGMPRSMRGCSARERAAASRPLKVGIGGPGRLGQDRAHRGALPPAPRHARHGGASPTTSTRRRTPEFLVRRGAPGAGAGDRGGDRRLPAHGDPRGRLGQPRGRVRAHLGAFPDLDLLLIGERRRQSWRRPSAPSWSTPRSTSSTWPRARRSRAGGPDGSCGRALLVINEDRPGAVRGRGPRRDGAGCPPHAASDRSCSPTSRPARAPTRSSAGSGPSCC